MTRTTAAYAWTAQVLFLQLLSLFSAVYTSCKEAILFFARHLFETWRSRFVRTS